MLNKKVAGVVGFSIMGLFFIQSVKLWDSYQEVIDRQMQTNTVAEQVAQQYQALIPFKHRWEKTFPPESQIKDLVSVYRLMDLSKSFGGAFGTDILLDLGRAPYVEKGELGLAQQCIGNDGQGVRIVLGDLRSALAAVRQLESDPKLRFEGMQIKKEAGRLVLRTQKLCLLYRAGV
ncbi:TPA: hypothetical protein ACSP3E_003246 [Aeromonas veronii]